MDALPDVKVTALEPPSRALGLSANANVQHAQKGDAGLSLLH